MAKEHHGIRTFIIAAQEPVDEYFQGYFYDESDYIYGTLGLAEYMDATGRSPRGGLDGCYVYARRRGDTWDFDCDFSGYHTLYYFHDGRDWGVSNSFAELVDYRRSKGMQVTPHYAHLGAISSTNSTNNQLFSWSTVAREINVAPRGATIRIGSRGVRFKPWQRPPAIDYDKGLVAHIELWTSRFETLLTQPEVQLSIDLTGGVDSRSNFALALHAVQRLGSTAEAPRFTCQGEPETSADARVAMELCSIFGFELNGANKIVPPKLTPAEGISTWRQFSLGTYYPLILPAIEATPNRVHVSGGGGEVHRDFYVPTSLDGFFKGHARRNRYPWLGHESASEGCAAAAAVSTAHDIPLLRAHYREFRHRFHSGRAPRQTVSFTPLDSSSAEIANANSRKSQGPAFNYDVIHGISQDLLDVPYDKESKAPSREDRSALTTVDLNFEASPGTAWGLQPLDQIPKGISYSRGARHRPLRQAVEEAAEDPFAKTFWGSEFITIALGLSADLAEGEGIGNPVNGYPISALLSAYLVSPSRTQDVIAR